MPVWGDTSVQNSCPGRHLGHVLTFFLTEVVGFRLVMNGFGDTSGVFRADNDRGLEFSLKNACLGRHLGSKLLSGETPRACFNVFLTELVGFRLVMNGFGDTSGMFRANSDRGLGDWRRRKERKERKGERRKEERKEGKKDGWMERRKVEGREKRRKEEKEEEEERKEVREGGRQDGKEKGREDGREDGRERGREEEWMGGNIFCGNGGQS